MQLPGSGTPLEALLARMRERKAADADWRGGRTWSLVYPAGEDVDAVLRGGALCVVQRLEMVRGRIGGHGGET